MYVLKANGNTLFLLIVLKKRISFVTNLFLPKTISQYPLKVDNLPRQTTQFPSFYRMQNDSNTRMVIWDRPRIPSARNVNGNVTKATRSTQGSKRMNTLVVTLLSPFRRLYRENRYLSVLRKLVPRPFRALQNIILVYI